MTISIYIVEDQELIRKSLKIVIESMSEIQVIGMAENGEEGVRLCENKIPDIILMDIQMPKLDGVKATKMIKERWPEVKVIILTTFQDITYVKNAMNVGAEGYILKAVDPQFLIKGIELVFHGGSLVPQQLAKEVYQNMIANELDHEKQTNTKNPYDLNSQELKMLSYLALGLQNKAISERMFLSLGTVKNYISSIYSKLNVKNRTAAIMKAIDESIISQK
ncbi:response regulator transcription factor [Bacillus sp. 03113]|uniref:response regulator transcription factor n=1 Tax=Bacillus sp. 03113 TaxID=2578211 RepID=UPI0011418A2D|nr:response regulator transcription factor [Bacillus sp. 03113]